MLFNHTPDIIGLDISERSLKAVQFTKNLKNQTILKALSDISLNAGIIEDGKIIKSDELSRAIIAMIQNPKIGHFNSNYVAACLPDTKTFIKVIDIPPMSEAEMSNAIKWEAEHHIPLDIDDTYWDWQRAEGETTGKKIPIIIAVSPKELVQSYTEAINNSRLVTTALEVESVPIVRSLIDETSTSPAQAIIIIDIGASRTGLCVYDKQSIHFSISVPISGLKMTTLISKSLNITEDEAEKAKIICGFDFKRCEGGMRDILKTVVEDLVKRINDTVSFYKEHFPTGNVINKILLCGGGANFKFIDQVLTDATGIETIKANPWVNLSHSKIPLKMSNLLSYTTAIGLALRDTETDYD